MGRSVRDIQRLCDGAEVESGLALHGGSVQRAEKDIQKWILV